MKELYSDNIETVQSCIEEFYQAEQSQKSSLASLWQKCIDFANGKQGPNDQSSPLISPNDGRVVGSVYSSRNHVFVTNEIEPLVKTLGSYMTRAKPAVEIFQVGDKDDSAKRKAFMCEKVHEVKYDMDKEIENSSKAAFWALSTGNVFRKDYWDLGLGEDIRMPQFDELGNEVIGEDGQVVTTETKTGDNAVSIIDPFRISVDWSITDFDKQPVIIESYMMPIEWAKEAFDRTGDGFLGGVEKIGSGALGSGVLSIFEQLKYSIPFQATAYNKSTADKCLILECYIRPNKSHPKGRLVIIAGGVPVYSNESPYWMPYRPLQWHPYTMFGYEPYVGRFWFKGLVEQLLTLQMRLNEINVSIIVNANTMAKPDWIAAENQLARGVVSGNGGSVYTFKPRPDAPPPTKLPGVPLPAQFFQEKGQIIEAMVRIAATNFVMQGQPPPGVTAGVALEQVLENATNPHSDMIYRWSQFHSDGFTKKLRNIRKFMVLPSEDFNQYLRAYVRNALEMDIEAFIGEDLGDGFTVKIEPSSMVPKSEKLKKDLYSSFASNGLLGNIAEDSPRGIKVRNEILSKFGEEPIETEDNVDFEKQNWENERIKKGEPAEVAEFDNDIIHLYSLLGMMKSPEFLEKAPDNVKQLAYQHYLDHKENIKKKEMEKLAMQQQLQPLPEEEGPIEQVQELPIQ